MPQPPARAPNVLVYFTDQQRWDTSSLLGCPLDLTPTYDRFAQRGSHFASAFTPQPLCGPARGILQTGLYPQKSGITRNAVALSPELPALAGRLAEAGYATGYIGKWHLGPNDSAGPVAPQYRGGYRDWLAANLLEFTSEPMRTVLYDNEGQPVRLPGYRVDAIADATIRQLDRYAAGDQPFLLTVSQLEPHHQNNLDDYPPPEGDRDRYAGRWMPEDLRALGGSAFAHWGGYCGMTRRCDDAFGRILDALTSLGLRDNTIVVYTSDHGCHFKTRNNEYKRSCHESSTRIPLAIDGPGFRGGGRIEQLASLIDIPATLLDACGVDGAEETDGLSLHRLVNTPPSQRADADWRDAHVVQTSEAEFGRSIRTDRWKLAVLADVEPWSEPGRIDEYREAYFYDLHSDPHELTNLAGSDNHAEIRQGLMKRLADEIQRIEGESPTLSLAEPRSMGQRSVGLNLDWPDGPVVD